VEALSRVGVKDVIAFHGAGVMDELSTNGPSQVVELLNGVQRQYQLDPRELKLAPASPAELRGGDPAENAQITRDLLAGEQGPRRDVVLLNAAAALRVSGTAKSWDEGVGMAAEAIDRGRAAAALERWVRVSQETVLA
jgi:anthranilate phosphoribosyltransferase